MNSKRNPVKVSIGGEEFSLRSDRSEEYTRAVASHVDRAVRDVRAGGAIIESHKAAVLAALSITDELFKARMAARDMEERLTRLTMELERFIPPQKRSSKGPGAFASAASQR